MSVTYSYIHMVINSLFSLNTHKLTESVLRNCCKVVFHLKNWSILHCEQRATCSDATASFKYILFILNSN